MSERRHPYLKYLRIDRFGMLTDRSVGPFCPGLNIVFGENEAGKTTIAQFMGGVLFGWEEARGNRNTYKPDGAERAGSLLFEERAEDQHGSGASSKPRLELRRVRNVDGLQGSEDLVSDIDRDTFRTMFSLSGDELRSLRNAGDMTARLLTAGSGTSASPAQALTEVEDRLATYTSRAAAAEHSITRLAAERAQVREELARASRTADRLRSQDREFHALESQRRALAQRIEAVNAKMDTLAACRSGLGKIEAEESSLLSELGHLHEEERRAVADRRSRELVAGRRLARLSESEDRALYARLDLLDEKAGALAHAADTARSAANASSAVYEAMQEAAAEKAEGTASARHQRHLQIGALALMCALLELLGVPLFVDGYGAHSLAYASLGLVMIVVGLMLAVAAAVLALRPDRRGEQEKARREAAHQAMLQDAKKLEAAEQDQAAFAEEVALALDEMGLSEADGMLSQARALLDQAREIRVQMAADQQKQQAASKRVTEVETRLEALAAQRKRLLLRSGLGEEASPADFDHAYARLSKKRAALSDQTEAMNRRWGELSQELSQARSASDFAELKMRLQNLNTRIADSTRDFARLLMAKHLLESAISEYNAKSQPEVYAFASRLLSLMTEGRWTRVELTGDGGLRVIDAEAVSRTPQLLSLGTCQQLFLALRIALLIGSPNVGRAVPVLADDILVNFDAARRRGAAAALAELARTRQVILFTCHEEVVRVLREADGNAAVIEI